jgi:hypothetical protein
MHHKRGRPKNQRAGCLMCKPWKANGGSSWAPPIRRHRRAADSATEQLADARLRFPIDFPRPGAYKPR